MPELPDVESARRQIQERALHRRIADVYDSDTYVSRPHAPGEIADALTGRELVAVNRRGKSMWCETSEDGPILGLHLGMAGRIAIDEPPSEQGWDRFVLRFEDGGTLALRDKRRLGRARLEPAAPTPATSTARAFASSSAVGAPRSRRGSWTRR